MSESITIHLTDGLSRRARMLARDPDQALDAAIVAHLEDTLPDTWDDAAISDEIAADMDREEAAYIRLHPKLRETFAGMYVAIHDGDLVDVDTDYEALRERINLRYPEQFVWVSPVLEEPIQTVTVRSPRIARLE